MEATVKPTPVEPASPASGLEPIYADDGEELTRLHPNYIHALRIHTVLLSIPFLIGSMILEGALSDLEFLPSGIIAGVVAFIALIAIIRIPSRRFAARGYAMSDDRLRVVRGIFWRSDAVVPFGRVQHIDVNQGPIERFLNIATLTVHTAGTHNSSVHLPGLEHGLASEMREEIRAHIKRESM